MKYILSMLMLLMAFGGCQAQQDSLEQFDWLLGKWQRTNTKPGQTAFEVWGKESETTFSGKGYTLQGEDTVFVEILELIIMNGKTVFSADVAHNPEKTLFELTKADKTSFVCVNEAHDFPNKIGYELMEKDALSVFISDMSETKKRYFEFVRAK